MIYRTLLKTIHKMLNSHQRCSDSSILCINAKICTPGIFTKFFRRDSSREFLQKASILWDLFFFAHPSPYFIQDSVVEGRLLGSPGGVMPENSAWTANYQWGRVAWSGVWHSTVFYEGTEVLLYFEDKKYWVSGQIIWKYRISAETVPDSQTGNICRNLW